MSEMMFFHQHKITMRLVVNIHKQSYFCNNIILIDFFRGYENLIFPQSSTQPYLVLVYSEWCLMCLHLLPMWKRLVDDLNPIGINLATVHYEQEIELAHKLGGRRGELPHIVLVMESQVSYFKEEEFSTAKVIGTYIEILFLSLKTYIFVLLQYLIKFRIH